MITKPTMFNIWIHCWAIIPSGLSLYWLSGRPVTVWTSRNLSDSAIEYGLMRNANLSKQFDTVSTHITLLHFVAITVIPLIWIIDIAFSEGNALGGQIGDSGEIIINDKKSAKNVKPLQYLLSPISPT